MLLFLDLCIQYRMSDVLARIWVYRNQSRQTLTRTRNAQHLPLLKSTSSEWSEAQSIWTAPQTSSSLTYPLSLGAHFQVIYLSSTSCEEINWSNYKLDIHRQSPLFWTRYSCILLIVSNTEQQVVLKIYWNWLIFVEWLQTIHLSESSNLPFLLVL